MQEYQSAHDRWGFLAPWTTLLCECDVRVRTVFLHDHTYRYKFEAIELTLDPRVLLDDHPHEQLQAAAEAVALLSTALTLHTEAWSALLVDQCGCNDFGPQFHEMEDLVPRFVFDCQLTPSEMVANSSAFRFFRALTDSTVRTNKFHVAMRQLLALPSGKSRVVAPRIPFKIAISLFDEAEATTHTMQLVQALKPFHSPVKTRSWCFLEAISVDLGDPQLNRAFIQQAMRLAAEAPLVQIEKLCVDPKELCCGIEELRVFLTAFMPIYPNLVVDLCLSPAHSMRDAHRVYVPDRYDSIKIARVMQAIASVPTCIKLLNIGTMLPAAPATQDHHQLVLDQLFGTLLHPSAACTIQTLNLSSAILLQTPEDAALIQAAASAWPGHKIPHSLILELTNADQASLQAIVQAFGRDLRHLRVVDSEREIESSTVSFIMETCPKLVYLDIDTVSLDTMNVFYDSSTRCQLNTLALSNVTLSERTSLEEFFSHLADPESPLGRTLSELVLVRTGDPEDVWDKLVLNSNELSAVENTLRLNGRIHTLQLDVEDSTPEWVLTIFRRHHRQPAAARQAPLALSNKLAFLSATVHGDWAPKQSPRRELSQDVIGMVFEFAAECMPRSIHVGKSFDEAVD